MENKTDICKTIKIKIMKIQIKNRFTGSIIFEHDEEKNSILLVVKLAIESGADLSDANLRRANLSGANLSGADLSDANLSGADLSGADLSDANLRRADLSDANLSRANLSDADLSDANLSDANLSGANLSGANLRSANLRRANLSGADLRRANLSDADLSDADLSDVIINEITFGFVINCPEFGLFTAFKKASGNIVKLLIPEDSKRSSATSFKCRCSKATVLSIENMDGSDSGLTKVTSDYNSSFVYEVGKTVEVTDFDENRWNECSTGIHFFMSREMTRQYN